MIDNELIKMCDTPEIQDRWEPKVGDGIYKKLDMHDRVLIVVNINEDQMMLSDMTTNMGIGSGISYHCSPHIDASFYIYIPRIEDVVLWLDENGEIYSLTQSCVNLKWFIKLYMELLYNKTWNGEAWV
jgi:hypothetical protein